jgi:hypothetical protein
MTPKFVRSAALFAVTLLVACPARACPLCESDTGWRVRAGIFDADFGYHLAVTLLPFPVLLGVAALIHFGPPWPVGRARMNPPPGVPETPPLPDNEDRP